MTSSNKSEYGNLLTKLIKNCKMTQSKFYNKYDIIGGKINPPPAETQMKILRILSPKEDERIELLDIAANDRNEIPADIKIFLEKNKRSIEEIRDNPKYKKFLKEIMDKEMDNYD